MLEINNPLAAVMNSLYLLEKYQALDDKARGFVSIGATQLNGLRAFVQQMLAYHRTGAQPRGLDVSEVVNESSDLTRKQSGISTVNSCIIGRAPLPVPRPMA